MVMWRTSARWQHQVDPLPHRAHHTEGVATMCGVNLVTGCPFLGLLSTEPLTPIVFFALDDLVRSLMPWPLQHRYENYGSKKSAQAQASLGREHRARIACHPRQSGP